MIAMKRKRISLTCYHCRQPFEVTTYRAETARYCSRACLGKANAQRLVGNRYAAGQHANRGAFRKGQFPWNKGLKGIHISPATEFKKGQPNGKLVPLGTVTIRKDKTGHLRRFIKLREGYNGWTEFARIVWLEHFGPIPRGKIIHHKDRDTLNDDPPNLALLSRAEHLNEHRSEIAANRKRHPSAQP